MRLIWVFNTKKLKRNLLILIAAFFAASVAFIQNEEVPAFKTKDGPKALSKVSTNKKQLALTFDISWGDVRVGPIVKFLEKEDVTATFFVSGQWAERHEDIIDQMVKDGFEIGSHGMTHKSYTELDASEVRKDIVLAKQAIQKASGETPKYLRPPNGLINKSILETAVRQNQQVILWSVNANDWLNPGSKLIAEDVIKNAGKGDIILLHASDSAKQTLKALPEIIEELQDKGYSFVSLTRLISNAKTKSEIIE